MSNDLILLNPTAVPAHILAAIEGNGARFMNEDASFGLSTGMTPSIRTKNGRFRTVDSNKEEVIIQAKDLKESKYLPVVVLGAKRELSKTFYAKAYDPNQDEAKAPDCASDDGLKPNADCSSPQCANCASCPHNVYGSGRNAAGQPTKGKACSDTKTLAVYYKGGIYALYVRPASLKNWAAYVKALDQRNFPLGHVVTYVSFDESSDFSVMVFSAGDFVPDKAIEAMAEKACSPEVYEITKPSVRPARQAQPSLAAPEKPVAKEEVPKPKPALKVAPKAEPMVEVPVTMPSDDAIADLLDL